MKQALCMYGFLIYLPSSFLKREEPGFSASMVGVAGGLLELVAAGLLSTPLTNQRLLDSQFLQ